MLMGIILICSITLIIIFFGVSQFKTGSQLSGIKQISNLSHLLIRQQANLFSILLMNNATSEQLSEALETFTKEEFVIDASIYATNGELLTKSENMVMLDHLGLLQQDKHNDVNKGRQQIVEPIYSRNGIEGFLRVSFDTQYNQKIENMIDKISLRLYAEFIIVFLIGIILASSIHTFLKGYYRSTLKENNDSERYIMPKRSSSISFHRRRKRFYK
nr:AhpA/YtjB family protein [Bisgaardia hudsonensis]